MSVQEEQDRFAEIMREHQRAHEFARLLSIEVDQLRAEVTRLTQEIEILEQVLKEEREEVKHHIEENERLKAAAVSTATKLDGHPPCRVCGSREHCYSARCRG